MTGLVYLAIIALWAVFLIPWVNRQREAQDSRRSADRYLRALDALASNHPERSESAGFATAEPEYLDDEPGRETVESVTPSLAWDLVAEPLRTSRSRSSTTAKRRRRVLALLFGALVGSLVASGMGVAPVGTAGVFIGLIAIYLTVISMKSAHARRAVAWRRTDVDLYREATLRAQLQAKGLLSAQPQPAPSRSESWDARPATLPTYVSKPSATWMPQFADADAPGRQRSGEAMVQRAWAQRERARAADAAAQFDREMAAIQPDPMDEVASLANATHLRPIQRATDRRAVNE